MGQRVRVKPPHQQHTWRASGESESYSYTRDEQFHRQDAGHQTAQSHVNHELAQHYASLETPYGSDLATVKKSWRRLVRQYHPDLHSDDPEKERVAQELTQGLNKAYEAIEKHLTSQ